MPLLRRVAPIVVSFAVVAGGCGGDDESSGSGTPSSETTEYKLAAANGEPDTEDEFAELLDIMQEGTEFCAPEPDREHAGDVLVASWEHVGNADSLLAFSQAFIEVCSISTSPSGISKADDDRLVGECVARGGDRDFCAGEVDVGNGFGCDADEIEQMMIRLDEALDQQARLDVLDHYDSLCSP